MLTVDERDGGRGRGEIEEDGGVQMGAGDELSTPERQEDDIRLR